MERGANHFRVASFVIATAVFLLTSCSSHSYVPAAAATQVNLWSAEDFGAAVQRCTDSGQSSRYSGDWKKFCECVYTKESSKFSPTDMRLQFGLNYANLVADGTIAQCRSQVTFSAR